MTLTCFAPHVRTQLEEIIKRGKIGLCPGPIKILNPMPSAPSYMGNVYCDRFNIVIPYGGHCVEWYVMFQASDPNSFPDFIFGESFYVLITDVNSLMTYDPNKSESFFLVLKELLQIFRRSQVAHLESYSRVQFEYSTLIQQADVKEEDIEVYIADEKGPINFLIRLGVSFQSLPAIFRNESDTDIALLLVTFNDPEGSKIIPKLCLPPKIELALGSPLSFRIPTLASDGCLMDYVPFVQDSLKKRVDTIANSFVKRKEFLRLFLDHFEGSYVEYDRDLASTVTAILEQNDFHFLLQMDLPQNFPLNKPSFTFRSIYHFNFQKPYSTTVSSYAYHSGWSAEVLLEKTVEFIREFAETFQRDSVRNGSSP